MSDMMPEVNLLEVSQLFQVLGVSGPITDIEFDDIYFTGAAASRRTSLPPRCWTGLASAGPRWPARTIPCNGGGPGHQRSLEQFSGADGGRWNDEYAVRAVRDLAMPFYRVLQSP